MADGALQAPVEGGSFRFCTGRDWRAPHTEKLLETNAGLLRNYLEAGQLMQRADFIEVGARTVEALRTLFLDPAAGLFHASIDADDEYYSLDGGGRRTRRPPRCDGRFLADSNARAVSASAGQSTKAAATWNSGPSASRAKCGAHPARQQPNRMIEGM